MMRKEENINILLFLFKFDKNYPSVIKSVTCLCAGIHDQLCLKEITHSVFGNNPLFTEHVFIWVF